MKALTQYGACSVSDLARQLEVSDETIRRDVKAMADKGLVEKVHGGVVLPQLLREPAFRKRMERNAGEKERIARLAAVQVRNGDSVMLDTGSTTAYVARELTGHSDLLIVTNCTEIAVCLVARNRVYLAGGELRADDGAVFGETANRFVDQFRARYAVLSIGAIDRDGLMDFYLQEAEFSRALMGRADQTIVVADHSKFGSHAPVKVCGFEEVDLLITDRAPPPELARRLTEAGTNLLIAD
jgi:DeoR family glycerol-3-phosphate regulon repressor